MKFLKSLTLQKKIAGLFILLLSLLGGNFLLHVYSEYKLQYHREYLQHAKDNTVRVYQMVHYARRIADWNENDANDLKNEITKFNHFIEIAKNGGEIQRDFENYHFYPIGKEAEPKIKELEKTWKTVQKQLETVLNETVKIDSTFSYYVQDKGNDNVIDLLTDNLGLYRLIEKKWKVTNPKITNAIRDMVKKIDETDGLYLANQNIVELLNDKLKNSESFYSFLRILIMILSFITIGLAYYFIITSTIKPLKTISEAADLIASGDLSRSLQVRGNDEIGSVIGSINLLNASLQQISTFATQIGQGNFSQHFEVRSKKDRLGYALINMRESLREVADQDKKRNWANEGMAKFGDILRNFIQDVDSLSYEIIANLVKYVGANQGGLFLLNEEDRKPHLVLSAAYAYNKKKFLNKRVELGQGLLGQCILEKSTIYITEVPEGYIHITSGLGEATPNAILIVPLIANNTIHGALEIASFSDIEQYKIDFVEKLSQNIASTISTAKANAKTKRLLEESQMYTEQLRAQEEEMRQNMEELSATQEEMNRVQLEIRVKEERLNAVINNTQDNIVGIDVDYNITIFNQAFYEYTKTKGYEVFVGMNYLDALSEHEKDVWKRYFDRALRGDKFFIINTVKFGDFNDIYYQIHFNPIANSDGEVVGCAMFTRDVTALNPIRWAED